jgi:hypothetical protein
MRKVVMQKNIWKQINLHEIFSSGVIPDNNAKEDKNSRESTRLFYKYNKFVMR